MNNRIGLICLVILMLGCVIVLTGCEEMYDWEEVTSITCETYEEEVEAGVCSYYLECDDTDSCEVWGAQLIHDMEEWFGELTYSEEWDFDEKESEKETASLAAYPVRGNSIGLRPANEDEEYYAWLWDRFAWVIPSDQRTMISSFEVYDHADLMAYVIQSDDNYEEWTYAANQIQATYETERILTDVHEFGHLLALNSEQVDPYVDESDCQTYMLDEGCAREDSYIYAFYYQFWEDDEGENENHFVTEYAMSDIYEDFAETWSHYVMTPRPKGNSVIDQKLLFFYQYEELIMLKAQILGRVASWLDRNVEY